VPDADHTDAVLVARRAELLAKIKELRGQVARIDKQLADRAARAGLARRLANLTAPERALLDELATTKNLDQMGLLNRDGTARKRPR